ncbi:LsbB family leaderless bacteriocin [Enterococcus durans]|uniref:LsbB family leaderless bacteriocin n=1 Tax=Enterococcus durans TaxID=53345 RepID=UPI000E1BDAD8|nr:LsbB family leaderless bacteriocin [Enterococcus durans]
MGVYRYLELNNCFFIRVYSLWGNWISVQKLTRYEIAWFKNKHGCYPWEIPRC